MEESGQIKQSPYQHKYIDKGFWAILIFLMLVSVVSIFSASSQLINKSMAAGLGTYRPIVSHIGFLIFGAALAYAIQFIPSWFIRMGGYILLAFSMVCLLLTFTKLGESANEAARWIRLGPVQFQPSELAKLSLIIVVSDLLARIKTEQDRKKYFWIALTLTGVVCLLIVSSNLSTVILIGAVVLVLMFLARIPWKWLTAIVGTALLVLVCGYLFVEHVYVKPGKDMSGPFKRATVWVGRIDDMIDGHKADKQDSTIRVTDDNYQSTMAQVAVARGGQSPFGVGPGNSVMRNKLPLAFMDFIFAIIVEETGLVGAVFLIILYMSILCRACIATSRYADYSALLMVMGLAIMLTTQAFISMAVAVGLGPVTGQPLPLISKGGTSILTTCLYFGIMMSVCREQNMRKDTELQTREESRKMVPDLEMDDSIHSEQS